MAEGMALTGGAKRIHDYVSGLLVSHELEPGARLPTERVLAEKFSCTRTEVRRALRRLEVDGRVLRHVGRGTFVSPDPAADTSPQLSSSPADLMAARLLLEPKVTSMAALQATEEDFMEMDRCLNGGDSTDAYEEFEAWDMALHRSFAVATHNNVVIAMVNILHSSRHNPVWGGMKRRSFSASTCSNYREEHREIVEALRDRNPDRALTAMTNHLESVRAAILG